MSVTWHVGDLAECYSVTHAEWCRGEVVDLKSDGVVVRYHVPGGMLGLLGHIVEGSCESLD